MFMRCRGEEEGQHMASRHANRQYTPLFVAAARPETVTYSCLSAVMKNETSCICLVTPHEADFLNGLRLSFLPHFLPLSASSHFFFRTIQNDNNCRNKVMAWSLVVSGRCVVVGVDGGAGGGVWHRHVC